MPHNDGQADLGVVPDWMRARLAEMDRRNASLRNQIRLLGIGFLACMAGVAALGMNARTGPGYQDITETSALIIRDDRGVARAELSVGVDGDAVLALRDHSGVDRGRFAVRGDGSPGLAFADGEGNRRIVLGLLPDQTSTMVFADRGGVIRAVLGLSEDDRSNLVFADNHGVTRVGLGVDSEGTATVMLPEFALGPEGDAPGGDS